MTRKKQPPVSSWLLEVTSPPASTKPTAGESTAESSWEAALPQRWQNDDDLDVSLQDDDESDHSSEDSDGYTLYRTTAESPRKEQPQPRQRVVPDFHDVFAAYGIGAEQDDWGEEFPLTPQQQPMPMPMPEYHPQENYRDAVVESSQLLGGGGAQVSVIGEERESPLPADLDMLRNTVDWEHVAVGVLNGSVDLREQEDPREHVPEQGSELPRSPPPELPSHPTSRQDYFVPEAGVKVEQPAEPAEEPQGSDDSEEEAADVEAIQVALLPQRQQQRLSQLPKQQQQPPFQQPQQLPPTFRQTISNVTNVSNTPISAPVAGMVTSAPSFLARSMATMPTFLYQYDGQRDRERLVSELEASRKEQELLRRQSQNLTREVELLREQLQRSAHDCHTLKMLLQDTEVQKDRLQTACQMSQESHQSTGEMLRKANTENAMLRDELLKMSWELEARDRLLASKVEELTQVKTTVVAHAQEEKEKLKVQLENAEESMRMLHERVERLLTEKDQLRRLVLSEHHPRSASPVRASSPLKAAAGIVRKDVQQRTLPTFMAPENGASTGDSPRPRPPSAAATTRLTTMETPTRTRVMDSMERPDWILSPDTNHLNQVKEYMKKSSELDLYLRELAVERDRLQREYTRLPSVGGDRRRRDVVEQQLDELDHEISMVRMKLKSLHAL